VVLVVPSALAVPLHPQLDKAAVVICFARLYAGVHKANSGSNGDRGKVSYTGDFSAIYTLASRLAGLVQAVMAGLIRSTGKPLGVGVLGGIAVVVVIGGTTSIGTGVKGIDYGRVTRS